MIASHMRAKAIAIRYPSITRLLVGAVSAFGALGLAYILFA
jgi:hypothetical protein